MTDETRAETTPETPENNTPVIEVIEIDMPPAAAVEPERATAGKRKDEPVIVLSGAMLNYAVVALTFLVVGVLIGMSLGGKDDLSEAKLEQIIRNVMADMDFGTGEVDRFELVDDDPYIGAEDAPVVIVEFSDFKCPYCGRHYSQTLTPLLENYGEYIRYVYRDFPIITAESMPAAQAAGCANEQGAFWKFHNAFFENQDLLGRDYYIQTAEDNGLDVEAYTKCLDEGRYTGEITSDLVDGQLNEVQGTPGFFINGKFIRGAQAYEVFEKVVLRELKKAGIDPATGTATVQTQDEAEQAEPEPAQTQEAS